MPESARWHGVSVLVLGGAGLLIAAGITLADTSAVDVTRGVDLPDLVENETERVTELEERAADLAEEVEGLTSRLSDDPVSDIGEQAQAEAHAAGFSDVEGPGLTVSLDDAPVPEDLADLPPGTSADDFVVHQQDVEAVVNALWTGGAEAMQIMNRRVTSVSGVRCVGNVIILDGQVYSPPFTITAIGDPESLESALDRSAGVQIYRQWADYIGLGYSESTHDNVRLPAATGPSTLSYADVWTEQA